MSRVVTTEQLHELNEQAIAVKGHRSLDDGFWQYVDPEGRHLLERPFPYGESQDGPCYRWSIIVKMSQKAYDEGKAGKTASGTFYTRVMLDLPYESLDKVTKGVDQQWLFEF